MQHIVPEDRDTRLFQAVIQLQTSTRTDDHCLLNLCTVPDVGVRYVDLAL